MRSRRSSQALLCFCSLLFGCTEVTPPPQAAAPREAAPAIAPQACFVRGVVTSDKAAPVPGALVAAIPAGSEVPAAVTKTDEQGRYCITALDAGSFGFTVTAPELTGTYVDVRDVTPGSSLDVQVGGPGHVLSGIVRDERGTPLPNARVHVGRQSTFLADVFITDAGADGRYHVKLPEAEYAPFVRSDTHLSNRGNVSLHGDATADVNVLRLNPRGSPAPDEVVAWIRAKAIPLVSAEAGKGLSDMAPLAGIVGGARLVALGEATHGTREFFQMKHRMLEFLVAERGFRSFAIEASFADCLPLSEYVRTGKGDPEAALANQGFWTWDTQEVLSLVKWMSAYNEDKAHKEKLSLWGFDMQSPAGSAHAVLAYLRRIDPAFAKEVGPALEPIDDDFTARWLESLPAATRAATAAAAKRIAAKLDAEERAHVARTSARDLALARVHARVLVDFMAMSAGEGAARDRSMADVAAALLAVEEMDRRGESSPAKMVLWAHNGHVDRRDNGGIPSMGSHLVKRFGAGYVVFGFAFDEGSFQSIDAGAGHRGLTAFTVAPAPPGSLDHTLARATIPLFALDLRRPPEGAVSDWLSRATFHRSIGSMFAEAPPDYGLYTIVAPEHFDALFFVQRTTAARPNDAGRLGGARPSAAALPALADPGFEAARTGELPAGWGVTSMPRNLGHRAIVADRGCASGKRCLSFERVKGDVSTGVGSVAVALDATSRRGQKIRVTASARVEGKGPGDEAFVIAMTRDDQVSWGQVPGASWKKVQVDIDVPADAQRLRIGLVITGAARGGLDDVEVVQVSR